MKGLATLLDELASTADTKEALLDFASAKGIQHPPVRRQFKVIIGDIKEILRYNGEHDRKNCLKMALTMKHKMSSIYDALDNLNRNEMTHFGKNALKLTGLGGDKVSRIEKVWKAAWPFLNHSVGTASVKTAVPGRERAASEQGSKSSSSADHQSPLRSSFLSSPEALPLQVTDVTRRILQDSVSGSAVSGASVVDTIAVVADQSTNVLNVPAHFYIKMHRATAYRNDTSRLPVTASYGLACGQLARWSKKARDSWVCRSLFILDEGADNRAHFQTFTEEQPTGTQILMKMIHGKAELDNIDLDWQTCAQRICPEVVTALLDGSPEDCPTQATYFNVKDVHAENLEWSKCSVPKLHHRGKWASMMSLYFVGDVGKQIDLKRHMADGLQDELGDLDKAARLKATKYARYDLGGDYIGLAIDTVQDILADDAKERVAENKAKWKALVGSCGVVRYCLMKSSWRFASPGYPDHAKLEETRKDLAKVRLMDQLQLLEEAIPGWISQVAQGAECDRARSQLQEFFARKEVSEVLQWAMPPSTTVASLCVFLRQVVAARLEAMKIQSEGDKQKICPKNKHGGQGKTLSNRQLESIVSSLGATEEDKDAVLSRTSSYHRKRRAAEGAGQLVHLPETGASLSAEGAGLRVPLPQAGDGETSMPGGSASASDMATAVYKRKRGDSALLSDLIKVVEYALTLPVGAAREKLTMQKYSFILRSKVLSKWIEKYKKYNLQDMPPDIASQHSNIPEWWIEEQKLEVPRKGHRTVAGLPRAVATAVDHALGESCMGLTEVTQRADPGISRGKILRTITTAVKAYNEHVEGLQRDYDSNKKDALQALVAAAKNVPQSGCRAQRDAPFLKALAAAQAVASRPTLKTCKKRSSYTMVARLLKKTAVRSQSSNTSGNYMDFADPRMVRSRNSFKKLQKDRSIDLRMLLNFDQTWKPLHRSGKVFRKANRSDIGKVAGKRGKARPKKKVQKPQLKRKSRGIREDFRCDGVLNARGAFTVCLSCWGNGDHGPLAINCVAGTIPCRKIAEVNRLYPGKVLIMVSATQSHMFTAQTSIRLWEELYGPAIVQRRSSLSINFTTRGALMCDGFTGYSSHIHGEDLRRQRFSDQYNMELPEEQEGGWSAKGQMIDQINGIVKHRADVLTDLKLGLGGDLFSTTKYHRLELQHNGQPKRKIGWEDAVDITMEAFFGSSRSLNIVAWDTVGYITKEESFEMNGMNPVELQREIQQCNEDLANKLVSGARCFEFPSLESSLEHAQPGDSVYLWEVAKVHNPRQDEEDWARLPYCVVHPLERVLCHHARQPGVQKRQWFVVHAGYDGELPLAQSMKVTSVGPGGDRVLNKTTKGKSRSNLMMCNVGAEDRTLKVDDQPHRKLRCLHVMHTESGSMVRRSELHDVLADRLAIYASDGEDELPEAEDCAPEELHADLPDPPPEIVFGDGVEEVGDGEASETNLSEDGHHAEAEVEAADETAAEGAFATPTPDREGLPQITGCRLQKREPDFLYQVWYPGVSSHSESWRPDLGQSMEEAHDACLKWAWGKYDEGLRGE